MSVFVVPSSGPVKSLRSPNEVIKPHQIIKQIGIEFLQMMYSESGPDTRFAWNPETQETELLIVDKYSFNLDDVKVRPAIVANRGPQRWMNTSGFQQMQEFDFHTAKRISTDLMSGSVIFNCFSKEGLEAEALAADVFEWFRVFRDPLRKSGLFRVESTSMGEEALVKGDSRPDLSVVPVQVEASVQLRWSIEPYAPTLQNVVVGIGKVTNLAGSFNP
ncbi:MAG: hypothetical protein ACYTBJ_05440 [Planctomycetota bacterium]|jgi:hypothetical protein